METITADSLSMDPEAFRARMWEAGVPGAEPAGAAASGAGGGGDGGASLLDAPAAEMPPLDGASAAGSARRPSAGLAPGGAPAPARGNGGSLSGAAAALRVLPDALELESEGMAAVAAGGGFSGALAAKYPFFHAAAGDLTISDVGALLEAFKEAVLRYEALAGGYSALRGRGGGVCERGDVGVVPGSERRTSPPRGTPGGNERSETAGPTGVRPQVAGTGGGESAFVDGAGLPQGPGTEAGARAGAGMESTFMSAATEELPGEDPGAGVAGVQQGSGAREGAPQGQGQGEAIAGGGEQMLGGATQPPAAAPPQLPVGGSLI